MPNFIDLTGKKFNKLTLLKFVEIKNKRTYWLCQCECSKKIIVRSDSVTSGKTQSCGCLHNTKNIRHGHSRSNTVGNTPMYHTWQDMLSRCRNPNHIEYKNYGGRGIKVCKRWLKFENFLEDIGDRPSGRTIDRIDNNKGYFKLNCRWATIKEQSRNKRNNVFINYKNENKCLQDWADQYNMHSGTLWCRIFRKNMSIERALTTPVIARKRKTND